MKVKATNIGFYGKLMKVGEGFTLIPRSDKYITDSRKEDSDKKVTDAERKADIDVQFSSKWMQEVKASDK